MLSFHSLFLTALLMQAVFITAGAEELSIPVLVGQTGASATFGRNETDAYTLAAEEWNAGGGVNGKRVELRFEDTQTSSKQIVSAFHLLATAKPAVILGPTWLDGFQAVIPIARKSNILLVTPSAAREAFPTENQSWPVTFYHNSTLEIEKLIAGLHQRKFHRMALVYEQEPFAEMIRSLVLKNRIELLSDIGVQPGEADFHSHLTKLKGKSPDVLIVFVWDEKSLLSLLRQLRQHSPSLPLATVHDGAGWLKNPVFQAVLPRLIHTVFTLSDGSFSKKFKSRFGYEPMLTASNAYDALNSVLSAMAAGKSSAEGIREYLMTQELNTTTFGRFKFAPDGSVPSRVELVESLTRSH